MKQVLAIDMDDVQSYHIEHLLEVYNEEAHDNLKFEDITKWNLENFVKPEWKNRISTYFSRPRWFYDIEPRKDAQEVLYSLSSTFDIHIVSSSVACACEDKALWQAKHFPFISRYNIAFMSHKDRYKADYLVDDGEHNLINFTGIPIVFDKPWNRDCTVTTDGRQIHRAKDWFEIKKLLLDNRL